MSDAPKWVTPLMPPRVVERRIEGSPDNAVEISIPPTIAHELVGKAQHSEPAHSERGETLYATGGQRPIRWNLLGTFCAERGITADDLAPHVRRFDPEDIAEVFDAGPWDAASDLSEGEWSRFKSALEKVTGGPVELDAFAPWEINKRTSSKRDGKVEDLPTTPPPRRGGAAEAARQMTRASLTKQVEDVRREITISEVEQGIESAKRTLAKAKPAGDHLTPAQRRKLGGDASAARREIRTLRQQIADMARRR